MKLNLKNKYDYTHYMNAPDEFLSGVTQQLIFNGNQTIRELGYYLGYQGIRLTSYLNHIETVDSDFKFQLRKQNFISLITNYYHLLNTISSHAEILSQNNIRKFSHFLMQDKYSHIIISNKYKEFGRQLKSIFGGNISVVCSSFIEEDSGFLIRRNEFRSFLVQDDTSIDQFHNFRVNKGLLLMLAKNDKTVLKFNFSN